jgi:hypothetical protein
VTLIYGDYLIVGDRFGHPNEDAALPIVNNSSSAPRCGWRWY